MSPWLSRKRIFEMVMSGNSSLSAASTSPIERWSPDVVTSVMPVSSRRACSCGLAADEEEEHEPADLEVGEVVERRPVDPVVVDVGAVERIGVGDFVSA